NHPDAVVGFRIEKMKRDVRCTRSRVVNGDRAADERQAQMALPDGSAGKLCRLGGSVAVHGVEFGAVALLAGGFRSAHGRLFLAALGHGVSLSIQDAATPRSDDPIPGGPGRWCNLPRFGVAIHPGQLQTDRNYPESPRQRIVKESD